MLLSADQKRIRQVGIENVLALEEVCAEAGGLKGELQGGLGFIYPGTKWCGPGECWNNDDIYQRKSELSPLKSYQIAKKAEMKRELVLD